MTQEQTTAVISARCTPSFMAMVDDHCQANGIRRRGDLVIAAIECFMAQGKRDQRIPTPKKKVEWKPLSQHTKARLAVLNVFMSSAPGHFTSSDAAHYSGMSTNNASKRIQELASEGYLTQTGEYRKSRDSGKRLAVWKRTTKAVPAGIGV